MVSVLVVSLTCSVGQGFLSFHAKAVNISRGVRSPTNWIASLGNVENVSKQGKPS